MYWFEDEDEVGNDILRNLPEVEGLDGNVSLKEFIERLREKFTHVEIVFFVISNNGKKVLIQKRKDSPKPEYWDGPIYVSKPSIYEALFSALIFDRLALRFLGLITKKIDKDIDPDLHTYYYLLTVPDDHLEYILLSDESNLLLLIEWDKCNEDFLKISTEKLRYLIENIVPSLFQRAESDPEKSLEIEC